MLTALPPVRRMRQELIASQALNAQLQAGNAAGFEVSRQVSTGSFRPNLMLAPVAGCTGPAPADDSGIVERAVKAYNLAAKEQSSGSGSMWEGFFQQKVSAIHRVFRQEDFGAAAAILRDPSSSDLFFGFDSLGLVSRATFEDPGARQLHAAECLGGLVRLAEAIGALRLYNPAQALSQVTPLAADPVISAIEKVMGIALSFPNPFPNEHGLRTERGIVSYRAPQSLYQAWRIRQLVKGISRPRVLEIGAGLGRTAHFARALGIMDYTIIDLPFTGISQGYFLARTLGEDSVVLYGEQPASGGVRVRILPPSAFLAGRDTYDLIFNADSLTEMSSETARAYWARIESSTPQFLSINHETNSLTVKELIDGSARVATFERQPYWMRIGYVEELVRFG